jgi:hypothetical protein
MPYLLLHWRVLQDPLHTLLDAGPILHLGEGLGAAHLLVALVVLCRRWTGRERGSSGGNNSSSSSRMSHSHTSCVAMT